MIGTSTAALTDVMRFVYRVIRQENAGQVVEGALAFLEDHAALRTGRPSELARDSLAWLRADEEERNLERLTRLYESMLERADARAPLERWLGAVASDYIAAIEYLFPFLLGFAHSAHRLRAQQKGPPAIHVFLRDAMFFIPPLLSIPGAHVDVDLLVYTRAMNAEGAPRLLRPAADGSFAEFTDLHLRSGLVIDGGLYGSLIAGLIEKGHCAPTLGALFLGSRNPFIAGWLNLGMAESFVHGDRVDLLDVVRLVDTLEALFKPYRMLPQPCGRAGEPIEVELAEPLTFGCSILSLWGLGRWCAGEARRSRDLFAAGLDGLRRVKARPDSWFLFDQVPKWSKAESFVAGWNLGPLPPMDRLCGLRLD